MTARSYETIRVGLRRVIRDPNVKVKDRLEAIKLLMHVEGLMETEKTSGKAVSSPGKDTNSQELLDLAKLVEQEYRR